MSTMASNGRPPAYHGSGKLGDDGPPSYVSAITSPLAGAAPHFSAPPPTFSLSNVPRQPASSLHVPSSGFTAAEGVAPPAAAAAPPPRYSVAASTASSSTAPSLPKAYSPPSALDGRPNGGPSSPSLSSLPLPEAYKPPPMLSARKKTPQLSALPLPQAYVPPLPHQSSGHGGNIDTVVGPPPSPPPPKYPGTTNKATPLLVNARQGVVPGAGRAFAAPPRRDPSVSSGDGPPPEYSRSLSMPPSYSPAGPPHSMMLSQPHYSDPASNGSNDTPAIPASGSISLPGSAVVAVAAGIQDGASAHGGTTQYPLRQRKRSCSNPPPVLHQATVSSLLHFMSHIGSTERPDKEPAGESSRDLPSPPPYQEDSHSSVNNDVNDSGTAADEMPPAYDERVAETGARSNKSPDGVSLRRPLDLASPPAYTSSVTSPLRIDGHRTTTNDDVSQTTKSSPSPPAYNKAEEGTRHHGGMSRRATAAAVAPPLTFGTLGALPPPQYSPPTPKPGLIFPPVFGADGKSEAEASTHMALLRSATAAVRKFYLEGRRSHAERTRTLVDQFQNCRLGDFDLQTCRVIGRGSNGLVLRAAIRANSPHFDPSLWGRHYALKRRFLYTSPETFRAEFTTPFRSVAEALSLSSIVCSAILS